MGALYWQPLLLARRFRGAASNSIPVESLAVRQSGFQRAGTALSLRSAKKAQVRSIVPKHDLTYPISVYDAREEKRATIHCGVAPFDNRALKLVRR